VWKLRLLKTTGCLSLGPVKVEIEQLEKLNDFHQFLIEEVILRFEKELEEQFDF
jgi:hypothetical protein